MKDAFFKKINKTAGKKQKPMDKEYFMKRCIICYSKLGECVHTVGVDTDLLKR